MSRTSLALVLSLAVLSATPAFAQDHAHGHAQAAGSVAAEAADAAAAVDAFHVALKAGDTNVALAIMAPDVMIFEEGGAERSRDEYASHHLGSDAAFAAASEATVTRRSGWADGDIAWITSEGRTTGPIQRPRRRPPDDRNHGPQTPCRRLAHPPHSLVVARARLTLRPAPAGRRPCDVGEEHREDARPRGRASPIIRSAAGAGFRAGCDSVAASAYGLRHGVRRGREGG